jgi:hypothetical protein
MPCFATKKCTADNSLNTHRAFTFHSKFIQDRQISSFAMACLDSVTLLKVPTPFGKSYKHWKSYKSKFHVAPIVCPVCL